jgi:hypothetical protein
MATELLTPSKLQKIIRQDGFYRDGGGLYLQVAGGGQHKSWVFRYTIDGRERRMGLGSYDDIRLDAVRELRRQCREDILKGIDPIEKRKEKKVDDRLAKAKEKTFRECAEEWLKAHFKPMEAGYLQATKGRLKKYIYPTLGDLHIQRLQLISTHANSSAVQLIKEIVEPIWYKRTRTARMVQQIISYILDYALAAGYIVGSNAASMDEGAPLRQLGLHHPRTFHVEKHRESLPYEKIGECMAKLRAHEDKRGWGSCPVCRHPRRAEIEAAVGELVPVHQTGHGRHGRVGLIKLLDRFGINHGTWWQHSKGHPQQKLKWYLPRPIAAYAIEFLILTGVRKMQTMAVEWKEIDWERKLQICPWMKDSGKQGHKTGKRTRKDHVIVLSDAAMDILRTMDRWQKENGIKTKFVFLGKARKKDSHVSKNACNIFLKRSFNYYPGITIHGFRSTFKSWSLDHGYPDIDSKLALAHSMGAMNEIYGREASRIEPRRKMMEDWADYCGRPNPPPPKSLPVPGEIIPFPKEVSHEKKRSSRSA